MKIICERIDASVPNKREVIRYMRAGKEISGELDGIIDYATDKIYKCVTPRACYVVLPLEIDGEGVLIGNLSFKSKSLARHLCECHSACIMAFTIGCDADRVIRACGLTSSACGLAADAVGTAMVEDIGDELCRAIKNSYGDITPRFSAGYGDLSIEYQKDIIELLQTKKHIGVSLSDGGMMTPTKTVTAIVGIKNKI